MSAAALLFRFRVAVMVLLHVIGFFAPWSYFAGTRQGTLWLAASTVVARAGGLNLGTTTLTITLLGLACLVSGTGLRLWGTAYVGSHLAGPYAYLRHPLSLGSWLIAITTSLLMPLDGAAFFLVGYSCFLLFLAAREERILAVRRGIAASEAQPDWLRALLHEAYSVGFTLCFAIFAWRYNARILVQCLLICCGFSLIMRAVHGTAKNTNTA